MRRGTRRLLTCAFPYYQLSFGFYMYLTVGRALGRRRRRRRHGAEKIPYGPGFIESVSVVNSSSFARGRLFMYYDMTYETTQTKRFSVDFKFF